MAAANVLSLVFAVPFTVAYLAAFAGVWGLNALVGGVFAFLGNLPVLLAAFLLGIVGHEAIHAITWAAAGKMPLSSIHMGFQWKTLTPYAHCREPMEVNAYRIGALMPGLVVGILPALAGIITGSGWLLMFGLFFTVAAGGDMLILWLIRGVPAGQMVEDHPSQAGCYVIE